MTLFSADHLGKQTFGRVSSQRGRDPVDGYQSIVNSNLVLHNQLHCWASKVPKMLPPHWFPYVTLQRSDTFEWLYFQIPCSIDQLVYLNAPEFMNCISPKIVRCENCGVSV